MQASLVAAKAFVLVACGALLIILFLSLDPTALKLTEAMSILHDSKVLSNSSESAVLMGKRTYPISVDDFLLDESSKPVANMPSPACKPHFPTNGQPIKRIFFLHMRKAGGTVIRKYLKKVAKTYNLQFQAREGKHTVERPLDNATLYVTNLREPIARTISHYKYDQRWACYNLQNDSFVPALNNTKMSLDEFLNHTSKNPNKLWSCSTNCYIQWATGNFQPLSTNKSCLEQQLRKQGVTRIQQAHAILSKYNLIIRTEKLRDKHYIRQVENMFGVKGLARREFFPHCAKKSQAANKQVPLVISNATMKRLQNCNTPDSVLYQQLTTCPEYDFPMYNKSYFYL